MEAQDAAVSYQALADYRRRVAAMYAEVRNGALPQLERWLRFRRARDVLFRSHPQSPLSAEQKADFGSLSYYRYDPALRFVLPVTSDVEPEVFEVALRDDGSMHMKRLGTIRFSLKGQAAELSLFWIMGYGGGLFLPFRDTTNGKETYGGGRYLLDTVKHADLGEEGGRLVIDFNYAYNPSCAYQPRWECPLAPAENRLTLPIAAGEKAFTETSCSA